MNPTLEMACATASLLKNYANYVWALPHICVEQKGLQALLKIDDQKIFKKYGEPLYYSEARVCFLFYWLRKEKKEKR